MTNSPEPTAERIRINYSDPNQKHSRVVSIVSAERFAQVLVTAYRIGGFSVGIVASAGETYEYVQERNGETLVREAQIAEGDVMMAVSNTEETREPTELSDLYAAIAPPAKQ